MTKATTTNAKAKVPAVPAVPFVDTNIPVSAETPATLVLPGTAFFDQELGDVIFNKLMKAPVKDYQVLLRLSKLGATINNISKSLASIRDEIAQECELGDFLSNEAALTPETLNSPDYQEKSQKFGKLIQERIFSKYIDLAPLGTLTLDLTNPDWHAKAFIEGSSLSVDDIEMLDSFKIVNIIYPEEAKPNVPIEESSASTSTSANTNANTEEKTDEADDILVPNPTD